MALELFFISCCCLEMVGVSRRRASFLIYFLAGLGEFEGEKCEKEEKMEDGE